jgi:hypothetical protein
MFLSLIFACSDVEKPHDHDHHHENEVITTVQLSFVSSDNTDTMYSFVDLQDGNDAIVDTIELASSMSYQMSISVLNELESPSDDITEEVTDEADEHHFFIGGSVEGCSETALVQHDYLDQDSNGLPLGIENSIETIDDGSGELMISLRHMPSEDGQTTKTDGLVDEVCAGNEGALPGDWDVQVTFPLEVLQ